MTKSKFAATTDTGLYRELLAEIEKANGDYVIVPLSLAHRLADAVSTTAGPVGDFSFLSSTERALFGLLLEKSPQFVSLPALVADMGRLKMGMSQGTLMVHKRRIFLKLMKNNAKLLEQNQTLPASSQVRYTYIVGRASYGYAVIHSHAFYSEGDLLKANFGIHLITRNGEKE